MRCIYLWPAWISCKVVYLMVVILITWHIQAQRPIELLFGTSRPPVEFYQRFRDIHDFVNDHKKELDKYCPAGSLDRLPNDLVSKTSVS